MPRWLAVLCNAADGGVAGGAEHQAGTASMAGRNAAFWGAAELPQQIGLA